MKTIDFRFEFRPSVDLTEAEMTLHLALYAVEGLFGEARVRLDASYAIDNGTHTITVGGDNEVDVTLAKVFTRLLLREFGEDGFRVRRVDGALAEMPNLETSAQQDEAATAAA